MPGAVEKEGAGIFTEFEERFNNQEINAMGAELPSEVGHVLSQSWSNNGEARAAKGPLQA